MRILQGGIPLGCDNIGDEAILACVVRMLRERVPDVAQTVALTVATNDPATGSLGRSVAPQPLRHAAAGGLCAAGCEAGAGEADLGRASRRRSSSVAV